MQRDVIELHSHVCRDVLLLSCKCWTMFWKYTFKSHWNWFSLEKNCCQFSQIQHREVSKNPRTQFLTLLTVDTCLIARIVDPKKKKKKFPQHATRSSSIPSMMRYHLYYHKCQTWSCWCWLSNSPMSTKSPLGSSGIVARCCHPSKSVDTRRFIEYCYSNNKRTTLYWCYFPTQKVLWMLLPPIVTSEKF